MDITATGNITNTEAAAATASASNMSLDESDFLKLLLTQLQYQDPLSPQDSAEFTAQLTQFSSLEAQNNTNTTLSAILGSQESMQNASATNLIGKDVRVPGNIAHLTDTANLGFSLADNAASVKISVFNSSGTPVLNKDIGASEAGINMFTWDGKDNDGNQLPAGTYTFEVEALDAAGNSVETRTSLSGAVTDVLYEDNTTYLRLEGGIITTLSQILSVSERKI